MNIKQEINKSCWNTNYHKEGNQCRCLLTTTPYNAHTCFSIIHITSKLLQNDDPHFRFVNFEVVTRCKLERTFYTNYILCCWDVKFRSTKSYVCDRNSVSRAYIETSMWVVYLVVTVLRRPFSVILIVTLNKQFYTFNSQVREIKNKLICFITTFVIEISNFTIFG